MSAADHLARLLPSRLLTSRLLTSRLLTLAATAAAGVAIAGCGSSHTATRSATTSAVGSGSTTSATTTSTATRSTPAPPRRRARAGAPVGASQRVDAGGSTMSVTVTRVIDPLTGTGAALLPGMRAVGVQVTVRADAGATYDSTASGDWSVISTAGPASPLFIRQGVCQTPLVDFESMIYTGQVRSGCVAFSVPVHARVLRVRFSPHSRAPGSVAWR